MSIRIFVFLVGVFILFTIIDNLYVGEPRFLASDQLAQFDSISGGWSSVFSRVAISATFFLQTVMGIVTWNFAFLADGLGGAGQIIRGVLSIITIGAFTLGFATAIGGRLN